MSAVPGISAYHGDAAAALVVIVHRPEEALDCFLRTKMDVLVIGRHIIGGQER